MTAFFSGVQDESWCILPRICLDDFDGYIEELYMEDGSELYIDPSSPTGTLHNQYEPGFVPAREKSPLELLIENKDLLD